MEGGPLRRVWDLPVRIVHWLLVIGIAGSYATHKLGVAYFIYHLWFGYLVGRSAPETRPRVSSIAFVMR